MARHILLLKHLIVILIFLSLPFLVHPGLLSGNESPFSSEKALEDFWSFLLMTGHFYVFYLYFIPKFFLQRRMWAFFLFTLLSFALLSAFSHFLHNLCESHSIRGPHSHRFSGNEAPIVFQAFMFIRHNLIPFFLSFSLAMILGISHRWKKTEKEKLRAELAFLKSQINPHFLFNTLNGIYSLALEKSDDTPQAIVKLSGMMRYVITEATAEFVPLEKEIGYLSDFVALQQIRFGETLRVDFEISAQPDGDEIAPLLLIPLFENAFKYGVNPEMDSQITIRLILQDHNLKLFIRNRLVGIPHVPENQTGMGLRNTTERLKLTYPGHHQLKIKEESGFYQVELTLQLR
jgi:hypothetical protein